MSKGSNWGIGLGIGCLVLLIGQAALILVGANFVARKAHQMQAVRAAERAQLIEELRARGFVNETQGQSMTIEQVITQPTIYDVQVFKLFGDCTTDLCVLAQHGEIHGTVEGDLVFRGQVLIIESNAVVKGNLELDAQSVTKRGRVEGSITGTYQTFKD